MSQRGLFAVALTAALAACTEPPDDPVDVCAGDPAAAAPVLLTPTDGRKDVTRGNFTVETIGFLSSTGHDLAAAEAEIWTLSPDGSLRERVWWASIVEPRALPFGLDDGRYEGTAAFLGGLEDWRDHALRVRHVTRSAAGCVQPGAWSEPRVFRTDDGSLEFFDAARVRDFRITLPPESVAAINAQALPPGCVPFERAYYTGTLEFEGDTYENVGVKTKGGCGSSRDLTRKAALKISLDWDDPAVPGCPGSRRIMGLDSLTLNNMVQDPSFSHERMAYALFRALGAPAPRASPARVWVNGTFMGHYLHIETVNRRFLDRHYQSNQGMLYEGTYRCDLNMANVRDDDGGCLTREFRPDACDGYLPADADPINYDPLRELITRIDALPPGQFYPGITEILDWDRYLAMWAGEVMLSHWDGYSYNIVNNFRVYHDPAIDRWTILPSGLDQTFRYESITPWTPNGKIAQRCLAEPACEATMAAKLAEAVTIFERMNLEAMRQSIAAQLAPLIAADPGREFDPARHANLHAETAAYIAQQPGWIRALLTSQGF